MGKKSTGRLRRPGVYDLPAERYHSDPCEQPSLSASIARLMCARSPRHAWWAHPRLNPDFKHVDEQKFDVGTAAHELLLKGETICHVVEADSWRTAVAKEVRAKAREEGLVPLLTHQWAEVEAMIAAVRPQLAEYGAVPSLLTDGKPEQTLIWKEDGVTCRAMLDWLRDDRAAIDDLKTTSGSARPHDWTRRMYDFGADIQVAFYLRGLKALTGEDAEFRFVVVECAPPYAVSVVSLAPSALELAREKVTWAIATWRQCLETGRWPSYATEVAHVDAPPWEVERWIDAHYEEEGIAA